MNSNRDMHFYKYFILFIAIVLSPNIAFSNYVEAGKVCGEIVGQRTKSALTGAVIQVIQIGKYVTADSKSRFCIEMPLRTIATELDFPGLQLQYQKVIP